MPSPLAVYIHWPFCKSKCPYCDFNSHVRDVVSQDRWRAALLRELETMATHVPDRIVTSIFFGGGTPSLMPADTAAALIAKVHALWPVSEHIEITLEANPTSVEAHTFPQFKQAGINRVSLGVQSLSDESLKFLGRGHSSREALDAVALAAKTFDRYTFDLIYARPGQSVKAWEAELAEALGHAGDHLSLYQLTIEENTAFYHACRKGEFALPDEETSEALYRHTEDMMESHGLKAYEVSNYALPGQESRHNLSYWKGDDYVGVGPGAHGRITKGIEELTMGRNEENHSSIPQFLNSSMRIATQTLKSPERWLENVEKQAHAIEIWQDIPRQQEAEECLMMGLRLSEGIIYDEFATRFGYDLRPYLHQGKRAHYETQGLLQPKEDRLQTTLKGRLVLNRLTAELLV